MISRSAHANSPAIQARRIAADADPERKRRRDIVMRLSRFRSPGGQARFIHAQNWIIAWREAGFPAGFPELADWDSRNGTGVGR